MLSADSILTLSNRRTVNNPARNHKPISIAVQQREFIEGITLPLLSRLRLYDPSKKPHGLKKLGRKLGQSADVILHGWMKLPSRGIFTIRQADGSASKVEFNAHQSAYLAFASRALFGGYELAETMFLEAMLARSNCFYDVGANWGYYSLLAATHPHYHGPVYSFDVSGEMNAAISGMAKALECQTIEVMGHGLSNHSGYSAISADRATHLIKIMPGTDGQKHDDRSVPVARLDDLDISPPDMMKLDVEDHEFEVLEGARDVISRHLPIVLFESRNGDDGGKAGRLLMSYGYQLYGLQPWNGPETGIDLIPIHSDDTGSGSHLNLVAVPEGHESRWFDAVSPDDVM